MIPKTLEPAVFKTVRGRKATEDNDSHERPGKQNGRRLPHLQERESKAHGVRMGGRQRLANSLS